MVFEIDFLPSLFMVFIKRYFENHELTRFSKFYSLQADLRLIEKRGRDESTGEVISLSGKLGRSRMGDKAVRMKPQTADKEAEAARGKKGKRSRRDAAERDFVSGNSD